MFDLSLPGGYALQLLHSCPTSLALSFRHNELAREGDSGALRKLLIRRHLTTCLTPGTEIAIIAVSSEGFPSGQREQTVNLPALPSKVRILPPPPVIRQGRWIVGASDFESWHARGCSSMVEQKPSKLTTRVRFPSPAPGIESEHATHAVQRLERHRACSPCSSVVEHSLGKGEVARSIRAMGTRMSAKWSRLEPCFR